MKEIREPEARRCHLVLEVPPRAGMSASSHLLDASSSPDCVGAARMVHVGRVKVSCFSCKESGV